MLSEDTGEFNFEVKEESPEDIKFDENLEDDIEEDLDGDLIDEDLSDDTEEDHEEEEDEDDEFDIDEVADDDVEEYDQDGETIEGSNLKSKFNSLISKFKNSTQKISKKKRQSSEDDEEELGEQTALNKLENTIKTFVDGKIPALAKILNKNKDANPDATQEIDTSNIQLEDSLQVPKKKQISIQKGAIYAAVAIGVAVIFLMDDPPEENAPEKTITAKTRQAPKVVTAPAKTQDEPPVQANVEQQPSDQPTQEPPLKANVEQQPTEQPMQEPPLEANVEQQPTDQPIQEPPLEANVEQQPTEQPMQEPPLEANVEQQPSDQPQDINQQINQELSQIDQNQEKNLDELKNIQPIEPIEQPMQEPVEQAGTEENIPQGGDAADQQLQNLDMAQNEPSDNTEQQPSEENNEQVNSEPNIEEQPVLENSEGGGNQAVADIPEEIIPQPDLQPDISSEITKKLLSDLEVKLKEEKTVQQTLSVVKPTDPPSYEAIGMGLVYNCKGKHWACVEQSEYKVCRENFSWNKNESIPIECYPIAYLENDYDCALLQQEKIDSVADTNFCQ